MTLFDPKTGLLVTIDPRPRGAETRPSEGRSV
jgi:hypothetical protein